MVDWRAILRTEFPSLERVAVVNDGKASAWAEYRYLGGDDASHVHFVLGTGVGSSVVVNGRLIDGDSGEAGFLGHTRVTPEHTVTCSCDREGCLETIASAPGLVFEYNKLSTHAIQDFDDFVGRLASGDDAAHAVLDTACKGFGLSTPA
jgi:predicted NBD/HSP70 family sugar kinase